MSDIKIEVCLESVEDAVAAEQGGADRVELCASLVEGGTTPSVGTVSMARESIQIGLQVMIRPRGGDFLYSSSEFEVMRRDVRMARDLRADGVVLGVLLGGGQIDTKRTGELVKLAHPMSVTFHRAFDRCRDPFEALEQLAAMGVDRILTSGQESTVLEGIELITRLHERAGDRIIILPGCGITVENIRQILRRCGASEVHIAANQSVSSRMSYRNDRCSMGSQTRSPEYERIATSVREVCRFRQRLP